MHETLKSGVVLCELANRVSPRIVRKINSSTMPFAQRENIQSFCDAVKTLGVKDINNFAADDLYEAKNMKQVMICILSLGKRCWARGRRRGVQGRRRRAQPPTVQAHCRLGEG